MLPSPVRRTEGPGVGPGVPGQPVTVPLGLTSMRHRYGERLNISGFVFQVTLKLRSLTSIKLAPRQLDHGIHVRFQVHDAT